MKYLLLALLVAFSVSVTAAQAQVVCEGLTGSDLSTCQTNVARAEGRQNSPIIVEEFSRVTSQCVKKNAKGTAALNICFYNALIRMKDALGGNLSDHKSLVGTALIYGQATLGQVIKLLGQPERMNTTQTQNGVRVQLVYPDNTYVYLTNGHVTAVQN